MDLGSLGPISETDLQNRKDRMSELLELIACSELEYFLCYTVKVGFPRNEHAFLFPRKSHPFGIPWNSHAFWRSAKESRFGGGIKVKLFMLLILALFITGVISVNYTFLFLVCHHGSAKGEFPQTALMYRMYLLGFGIPGGTECAKTEGWKFM
ncbi:hypothetical protein PIB30_011273 [Stylosanthes scabra]|uniref:Uncharacterized protein n=1 Tax=Stylosanthes scabra TaxID=79078 RepID=A0ABU6U5P0_9FABA|nr:hypothetical protein [Stylosanthes scabra]